MELHQDAGWAVSNAIVRAAWREPLHIDWLRRLVPGNKNQTSIQRIFSGAFPRISSRMLKHRPQAPIRIARSLACARYAL
jgi:hypothetical protein